MLTFTERKLLQDLLHDVRMTRRELQDMRKDIDEVLGIHRKKEVPTKHDTQSTSTTTT